jgi:hypothetical protein
MTMRAQNATALAVLALISLGLSVPVAAADGAGAAPAGGAAAPTSDTPPGPAGTAPTTGAASPQRVTSGAWLGRTVQVQGSLGAAAAQHDVIVERLSPSQGRWVTTGRARADDQGAFTISWRASEPGHLAFRAYVATTRAGSAQADAAPGSASLVANLTVYRPARATWYGPGSYGRKTACGERMTHRLIGVASRTLPCGTLVEVYYRGASLAVPVVDRGPFSRATWDLTFAAARALGFTGSEQIGTLILGHTGSAGSALAGPPGA